MSAVDLWAFVAAFTAGSAMAIRAKMLRPHQRAWTHAPIVVWVSLSVTALGLLMAGVTIMVGAHASPREAMVYSLLAACAVVMLLNLNRNGRQADVRKREIASEVAYALELSGPPARYPGERPE